MTEEKSDTNYPHRLVERGKGFKFLVQTDKNEYNFQGGLEDHEQNFQQFYTQNINQEKLPERVRG
jgi:hypothetical protein